LPASYLNRLKHRRPEHLGRGRLDLRHLDRLVLPVSSSPYVFSSPLASSWLQPYFFLETFFFLTIFLFAAFFLLP